MECDKMYHVEVKTQYWSFLFLNVSHCIWRTQDQFQVASRSRSWILPCSAIMYHSKHDSWCNMHERMNPAGGDVEKSKLGAAVHRGFFSSLDMLWVGNVRGSPVMLQAVSVHLKCSNVKFTALVGYSQQSPQA